MKVKNIYDNETLDIESPSELVDRMINNRTMLVDGSVEIAAAKADEVADILGRLLDFLTEERVLSDAQVVKIITEGTYKLK